MTDLGYEPFLAFESNKSTHYILDQGYLFNKLLNYPQDDILHRMTFIDKPKVVI